MHAGAAPLPHVSPPSTCTASGDVLWRRDVAAGHGPGGDVFHQGPALLLLLLLLLPCRIVFTSAAAASMSDHGGGGGDGQREQCRRGVSGDVELDAAMALADMAGVGPSGQAAHPVQQPQPQPQPQHEEVAEEEELASTRLSLELGKVGIQSSSCSSSSSAAGRRPAQQVPAAAPGYGPRPRHVLTEAEKEAKRLRRVLANRESARQTILRRQAIRDELARKVADLSSQNESMKKEKETVMQEYLTLKETNKQLKEQVMARASGPAPTTATGTGTLAQQAEATPSTASPPAVPPQPSFLYASAAPPAVPMPVPYVWGSWAPGYEQGHPAGAGPPGHPPYAWYYPVVTDPRGTPPTSTAYAQPFMQEPTSAGGSGTAEDEDSDDDPCSLTLGRDVDRRTSPGGESGSRAVAPGNQGVAAGRETAAEARKRRKELTKLKQTDSGGRSGDE